MGVKPAIFQWSRLAQDLQEAPRGFGDPGTCGACGCLWVIFGPRSKLIGGSVCSVSGVRPARTPGLRR